MLNHLPVFNWVEIQLIFIPKSFSHPSYPAWKHLHYVPPPHTHLCIPQCFSVNSPVNNVSSTLAFQRGKQSLGFQQPPGAMLGSFCSKNLSTASKDTSLIFTSNLPSACVGEEKHKERRKRDIVNVRGLRGKDFQKNMKKNDNRKRYGKGGRRGKKTLVKVFNSRTISSLSCLVKQFFCYFNIFSCIIIQR